MATIRRHLTVTTAAVVAALACALPALAAWNATSSGATASGYAGSIGQVTGFSASAATTSVALTWNAVSNATGYTVTRTSPAPAVEVCSTAATTCTDSGLLPLTPYDYSVVATRHAWTGATATTSATTTNGALTFAVTPVAGTYTAGTSFPVTVQAKVGGLNDATYTGPKTLAVSAPAAPNGTSTATVSAAEFDATGKAIVDVTLFNAAASSTFTITDSLNTRSGSATVTVGAGAPTRLAFTSMSIASANVNSSGYPCLLGCTVAALGNNPSVSAKVSVVDTWGNPVSNLGGSGITVSVAKNSGNQAGNAVGNPSLTIPGVGLAQSALAWTWSAGNSSYDATITATGTYTSVAARFTKN